MNGPSSRRMPAEISLHEARLLTDHWVPRALYAEEDWKLEMVCSDRSRISAYAYARLEHLIEAGLVSEVEVKSLLSEQRKRLRLDEEWVLDERGRPVNPAEAAAARRPVPGLCEWDQVLGDISAPAPEAADELHWTAAGEEAPTPDDPGSDELPMHRSDAEVGAAWDIFRVPTWALAEFGCSEVALDDLCCGVTTCRDRDGVVAADRLAWLRPDQLEMVAASGHYSDDEVYPEPAVPPSLDLRAVDCGSVNHLRIRETTGGQWRDMVAAGLPVERALAGVLFDIMRDGIQKLPPHLLHALKRRPHVARAAAESIIVALQHVDHGF